MRENEFLRRQNLVGLKNSHEFNVPNNLKNIDYNKLQNRSWVNPNAEEAEEQEPNTSVPKQDFDQSTELDDNQENNNNDYTNEMGSDNNQNNNNFYDQ